MTEAALFITELTIRQVSEGIRGAASMDPAAAERFLRGEGKGLQVAIPGTPGLFTLTYDADAEQPRGMHSV